MSKKGVTIKGKLHIIERMPNSYYGVPRWKAEVNNIIFLTRTDSKWGYQITNYEGVEVEVDLARYKGRMSLYDLREV